MTLTRRAHKYKIFTDSIHKEGLGPIRQKTKVSAFFCVEWERACQSVLSWKPIVFSTMLPLQQVCGIRIVFSRSRRGRPRTVLAIQKLPL